MNADARSQLEVRQRFLSEAKDRLIIDADTHPSDLAELEAPVREACSSNDNYFHGRPIGIDELLADMNAVGVDCALAWQNPATLTYGADAGQNHAKLLQANRRIHEFSKDHPERILPAGWTDPKALGLERALALVDECVDTFGFPIVKLNPAQNAYPIDSEAVVHTVSHIDARGAVPAFHYGGDTEFTSPEGLEAVARRFPQTPIVAVHMGGGGSHYVHGEATYQKTRELGLRCPNLFFILSAKRDTHIESDVITYHLAGEPFASNLAWGSDAPYGRISWNFGGFSAMLQGLMERHDHADSRLRSPDWRFDARDRQRLFGGNLARLYLQAMDRVLAANPLRP